VLWEIYREQMERMYEPRPYSYLPLDVVYRIPWAFGPPEPPLRALYPILMKTRTGDYVFDPLAIRVGRTAGGLPFAFNPRYTVNPLVLIVGTPGAGKSASVKTMIHNLLSNADLTDMEIPPVVVVDPEGEYATLGRLIGHENMLHLKLGAGDYINLFDRPSKMINPFAWYSRILQVILEKIVRLQPGQAARAYSVLKKAIMETAKNKGITRDPSTWWRDDITLKEVYDWIVMTKQAYETKKDLTPMERSFIDGASTLLRRLDQWMEPPYDGFSRPSSIPLRDIFNYKLIVLDARQYSGTEMFEVFVFWIVYWSYGLMLEQGPLPSFGVRLVLVIDEAWALLRKKDRGSGAENPLEALARRGRKYGIFIIVATQTPEDVDEKMFSLFGTVVVGKLTSEKMVNKVVDSRGMPKRFKAIIPGLERGLLVWSVGWAKKDFPMAGTPLLVQSDYPLPQRMVRVA